MNTKEKEDTMRRINEVDIQLSNLKKKKIELENEIAQLENEKKRLVDEYSGKEFFERISPRARKQLQRANLATIDDLISFADGALNKKNARINDITNYVWSRTKSRKDRIMCIRNIGVKSAEEIVSLLEEYGL